MRLWSGIRWLLPPNFISKINYLILAKNSLWKHIKIFSLLVIEFLNGFYLKALDVYPEKHSVETMRKYLLKFLPFI